MFKRKKPDSQRIRLLLELVNGLEPPDSIGMITDQLLVLKRKKPDSQRIRLLLELVNGLEPSRFYRDDYKSAARCLNEKSPTHKESGF
ncbi:MAG: hypothetical protein SCALA702_04800 [Melioribacteraceae bacterium]|nr:MAG: hypothetical protein SCALA702_04800 [Melioribacteraceae bacterium]